MRSCCVFDSPRLSLPLLAVYLLSASSSTMWWTNTLRTSANEDLGTLAEYDPLTKPLAHRLGACTRSPSSTAHMAVTAFSHGPGQGDWPYVFHMVRSMGSRIERADPRQSLGFFGLVSLHRTSALTTLNFCSQPQSRRGRLSRCFFVGIVAFFAMHLRMSIRIGSPCGGLDPSMRFFPGMRSRHILGANCNFRQWL